MRSRLRILDLTVLVPSAHGPVPAVSGVSFELESGSCVGLVGESGCGKTLTALSLLGLVDAPARIASGKVTWDREGTSSDLLRLSERDLRKVRGGGIAMVFQDPMTALHPTLTIGNQMLEVLALHQSLRGVVGRRVGLALLEEVGLHDPKRCWSGYAHQLSGGMQQRVMIAMALAGNPTFLVADEPTTALDVTVQAQVLHVLRTLKQTRGLGLLLVTHDLGVVAGMADELLVMYAGKIVERGRTFDLLTTPRHPYTAGLLASVGNVHRGARRLPELRGSLPRPGDFPAGCRFHPRCVHAESACAREEPALVEEDGRWHACPPSRLGNWTLEGVGSPS